MLLTEAVAKPRAPTTPGKGPNTPPTLSTCQHIAHIRGASFESSQPSEIRIVISMLQVRKQAQKEVVACMGHTAGRHCSDLSNPQSPQHSSDETSPAQCFLSAYTERRLLSGPRGTKDPQGPEVSINLKGKDRGLLGGGDP